MDSDKEMVNWRRFTDESNVMLLVYNKNDGLFVRKIKRSSDAGIAIP